MFHLRRDLPGEQIATWSVSTGPRGSSPPGYRSLMWGQKEDAYGSRRLGGRCHAEGTTGQVVANPGTDHDDELVASRLGLPCLDSRIKGHRHTGRARVAGLLHDHVRLLDRKPEVLHHILDGGLADLGEDRKVDIADLKFSAPGQLPNHHGPELDVHLWRVFARCLHPASTGPYRLLGSGLNGSTGEHPQAIGIGAVGLEDTAHEPGFT